MDECIHIIYTIQYNAYSSYIITYKVSGWELRNILYIASFSPSESVGPSVTRRGGSVLVEEPVLPIDIPSSPFM